MKIYGLIMAAAMAGVLGGCVTDQVQPTLNVYHVVRAPESMYNCPVVKKWPSVKTLSDLQVARTIVQLAENNQICKSSLDSLHAFYADAAAKFEK